MTKLKSPPKTASRIDPPHNLSKDATPRIALSPVLRRVSNTIAPLWPLADYVAVNPFLGLADRDWLGARRFLRSFAAVETLMPFSYYRDQFTQRQFTIEDLEAAIDELLRDGVPGAGAMDAGAIASVLLSGQEIAAVDEASNAAPTIEPLTAVVDRFAGTDWSRFVVDEIGKYCAAHYDEGHAAWASPWRPLTLYQAWRNAIRYDRRAELSGLDGFRRFVATLPSTPEAAIAVLLDRLRVPRNLWERFLLSEVFTVLGWASRAKYQAVQAERGGEQSDDELAVIAIRLAYDVAVSKLHGITVNWSTISCRDEGRDDDEVLLRNCLQRASEIAYRRTLLSQMADGRSEPSDAACSSRKLARFVFCIDVRSERLRRALESCSTEIDTSGFAGFFGVPMEYRRWGSVHSASHVPAPLTPQFRVEEGLTVADIDPRGESAVLRRRQFIRRWRQAWKAFQSSAVGGFGFVETAGWWSSVKLVARTLVLGGNPSDGRFDGLPAADADLLGPQLGGSLQQSVSIRQQVDLAQSILKNLGLTQDFPRFVLLCGHGSETTNNPLHAGLDCGACCGHSGEASARFAAALLNQPCVRQRLAARGIEIPDDTQFLAALHNTITDQLEFFDTERLPPSHAEDLHRLRSLACVAAARTRSERMPKLGVRDDAELLRRARDWSEVRPEWGLAGNAALIVGPRSLTRDARFDGRTFLHDYDHRADEDGSVLELILTAPMIVAHWINMQYYASVVDNRRWGSGSKPTHNVVGRFGLLAGGGGDLLTGLPLQSLHDGVTWQHQPLRLQAVVAAPRTAIQRIVNQHDLVRNLLAHGWLYMVAVEEGRFYRLTRRLGWLPVHVEHGASSHASPEPTKAGNAASCHAEAVE